MTYRTVFEVLSCEDSADRSRSVGHGGLLEVNVLAKDEMEGTGDLDRWGAEDFAIGQEGFIVNAIPQTVTIASPVDRMVEKRDGHGWRDVSPRPRRVRGFAVT